MRILTAILLGLALPLMAQACDEEAPASANVNASADENTAQPAATAEARPDEKTEDMPNNPRHRALMGKLVETKEFDIQGQDAKHVLAKIETPSGHFVIADLGTRDDVKNAKLTAGEQIEVYGVVGRMNNRPLLIAEQMGEVINIKRTSNEVPQPTSARRDNELGGNKDFKSGDNFKGGEDRKSLTEKANERLDQRADEMKKAPELKGEAPQPTSFQRESEPGNDKDLQSDKKSMNQQHANEIKKDSELKNDDTNFEKR